MAVGFLSADAPVSLRRRCFGRCFSLCFGRGSGCGLALAPGCFFRYDFVTLRRLEYRRIRVALAKRCQLPGRLARPGIVSDVAHQ